MEKTCTRCGETKPVNEFWRKKKTSDELKTWCKSCDRDYQLGYRDKANDARRARRKAFRDGLPLTKTTRRSIDAFRRKVKLHYGCMNPGCQWGGRFEPCMLDFHHVDPSKKTHNIGNLRKGMDVVCNEINKCTVLCACCHRSETWGSLDCSKFPKCRVSLEGEILP